VEFDKKKKKLVIGAPYFLNRRSDSGLFGEDFTNDDATDSFDTSSYLQAPKKLAGQAAKMNGRVRGKDARIDDQAYQAAGEQTPVFVAQQPAAVPVQAYSPYQYVNRRMGDSGKESKDKPAAPAA
jgi:hypothetical protein